MSPYQLARTARDASTAHISAGAGPPWQQDTLCGQHVASFGEMLPARTQALPAAGGSWCAECESIYRARPGLK